MFTKNSDRLLEADIAKEFLARVVAQAESHGLTPDEHFTVDSTLLEAWAVRRAFGRNRESRLPRTAPKEIPPSTFVARNDRMRRTNRRPIRAADGAQSAM